MEAELIRIYDRAWAELAAAVIQRKHGFRNGTLGTYSEQGPELRTLILRAVDPLKRTLRFNTDIRSAKVTQIRQRPKVSALFYGTKEAFQLRISAEAEIITHGPEHEEAWVTTPLLARRCYLAEAAPGTPFREYVSGIPDYLVDREPTEEESVAAKINFALIQLKVTEMDALELDFAGHRRVLYEFKEGQFLASWIQP